MQKDAEGINSAVNQGSFTDVAKTQSGTRRNDSIRTDKNRTSTKGTTEVKVVR